MAESELTSTAKVNTTGLAGATGFTVSCVSYSFHFLHISAAAPYGKAILAPYRLCVCVGGVSFRI